MKFVCWPRAAGLLCVLVAAAGLWPRPGWSHGGHEATSAAPGTYRASRAEYRIPAVTLTDMDGVRAALPDALEGDVPVLVDFIFTTCTTICPVMSATWAEAQEMLTAEAVASRLVSISIDPEQDSPARLRAYAERFSARPGWRLFTGTLDDAIAVEKAFDAYRGDKANHVPLLFMRASADAPWVRIEGFAGAAQVVDEFHRMVNDGAGKTH